MKVRKRIMKKILALTLVLIMALSLATTAFAATATVTVAKAGHTYEAYQIPVSRLHKS